MYLLILIHFYIYNVIDHRRAGSIYLFIMSYLPRSTPSVRSTVLPGAPVLSLGLLHRSSGGTHGEERNESVKCSHVSV